MTRLFHDSDHQPLCHSANTTPAESSANLPGMFVAKSFLDILFFMAILAGLSDGSCPTNVILLTLSMFDRPLIPQAIGIRLFRKQVAPLSQTDCSAG